MIFGQVFSLAVSLFWRVGSSFRPTSAFSVFSCQHVQLNVFWHDFHSLSKQVEEITGVAQNRLFASWLKSFEINSYFFGMHTFLRRFLESRKACSNYKKRVQAGLPSQLVARKKTKNETKTCTGRRSGATVSVRGEVQLRQAEFLKLLNCRISWILSSYVVRSFVHIRKIADLAPRSVSVGKCCFGRLNFYSCSNVAVLLRS